MIEFGLTLEGTEDVVRRALEDSRRPPVQPRVRRDVSGPAVSHGSGDGRMPGPK